MQQLIHYGLHRHFTGSGSVRDVRRRHEKRLPLRRDRPGTPAASRSKNPVTIPDLHATIFTAMGISPNTAFDVEKRPFYATEDGKGRAVSALFV